MTKSSGPTDLLQHRRRRSVESEASRFEREKNTSDEYLFDIEFVFSSWQMSLERIYIWLTIIASQSRCLRSLDRSRCCHDSCANRSRGKCFRSVRRPSRSHEAVRRNLSWETVERRWRETTNLIHEVLKAWSLRTIFRFNSHSEFRERFPRWLIFGDFVCVTARLWFVLHWRWRVEQNSLHVTDLSFLWTIENVSFARFTLKTLNLPSLAAFEASSQSTSSCLCISCSGTKLSRLSETVPSFQRVVP